MLDFLCLKHQHNTFERNSPATSLYRNRDQVTEVNPPTSMWAVSCRNYFSSLVRGNRASTHGWTVCAHVRARCKQWCPLRLSCRPTSRPSWFFCTLVFIVFSQGHNSLIILPYFWIFKKLSSSGTMQCVICCTVALHPPQWDTHRNGKEREYLKTFSDAPERRIFF